MSEGRRLDGLLAVLAGLAIFALYSGGGAIVLPTRIDWLMSGDPAQGWLGWQFFRETPWLQWPLGATQAFGMELGSSIVFSDSIPLLAFLFKPVAGWLPVQFQYFGMWLAACFALQAWFGWKLARLSTGDRWLAVLGACFFALAPIACWRLTGHYALVGQWLLLAALYLNLRERESVRAWLLLLGVVTLVHAYLLVMCLALFMSDAWQRRWNGQRDTWRSLGGIAMAVALVGLLMWAAGYFMLDGVKGVGVGNAPFAGYHMNLQSPIDPDGLWSKLLPDRVGGKDDYEGFAYLGTGVLALAIASAGLVLARLPGLVKPARPGMRAEADVRVVPRPSLLVPLLCVAAGFLVIALSNRIALGQREVFAYALPEITSPLTSAFRVSGRFAWPLVYLAYFAILHVVVTRLPPIPARVLLACALMLQVADSAPSWRLFSSRLGGAPGWTSPMRDPRWPSLAERHDALVLVLPHNLPPNWTAIAEFASRHHMRTQAGSFARVSAEREALARQRITRELVEGPLDPRAIYVFEEDRLWRLASSHLPPGAFAGTVDGFRILAPRGCSTCGDATSRDAPAWPASPGPPSLLTGWSGTEPWGTWSEGPVAYAAVDLPSAATGAMWLEIDGTAFLAPSHPMQRVRVSVNHQPYVEMRYYLGGNNRQRRIRLPVTVFGTGPSVLLRFEFPDAVSPAQAGVGSDPRQLGLGVEGMRLVPVVN